MKRGGFLLVAYGNDAMVKRVNKLLSQRDANRVCFYWTTQENARPDQPKEK